MNVLDPTTVSRRGFLGGVASATLAGLAARP
ncbi:twin-arginine translocation signal domain-containing protein [Micromonospora soli]|nr:twin-arginine translocation signal domain-containing protein [Micromonospora sp. NBRC 110009]WKT96983.1 twin-arginine translocation signal domain-containing protein [Micromonospora sp. NBRC 110009]